MQSWALPTHTGFRMIDELSQTLNRTLDRRFARIGLALAASVPLGHDHAAMRTWAAASLAITLCPLAIWALGSRGRARRAPAVIDLRDGADRPSDAGTATAVATSVSAAQKTTLTTTDSLEKTP